MLDYYLSLSQPCALLKYKLCFIKLNLYFYKFNLYFIKYKFNFKERVYGALIMVVALHGIRWWFCMRCSDGLVWIAVLVMYGISRQLCTEYGSSYVLLLRMRCVAWEKIFGLYHKVGLHSFE